MGMHPDMMKAPSYYTKPMTKGGHAVFMRTPGSLAIVPELLPLLPPIVPLPILPPIPPLLLPMPMQAVAPPQLPQTPMAKGEAYKAKAPVW